MWTKDSSHNLGARPGQLRPQETSARILWHTFNADTLESGEWSSFAQATAAPANRTLWLDIEGTPGLEGLRALQDIYQIHHLALEDVQNGGQNPRLDTFPDHLYLVLQIPQFIDDRLVYHQLNIFVTENAVISVHEKPGLFAPVRLRLDNARGAIRSGGSEYLFYALTDLAVDHGGPVAQYLADALLELEDRVDEHHSDLSNEIYSLRRQLSSLLRMARRQREPLHTLVQPDDMLISGRYEAYWRDCLDHAERLSENLNWLRESAADLLNTHLALVSHRMNDVMKVLTVMSTVFVPLSFLVGLYGMNFDTESPWNLPELGWKYGYPFVWGVMLTVVGGILWFFRRRRWI